MQFDGLIDRPNGATLSSVLSGRRLDLIAPYARPFALDRLLAANHDSIRIITRLPGPREPPPRRLDNDPRDFVRLVERFGHRARILGSLPYTRSSTSTGGMHISAALISPVAVLEADRRRFSLPPKPSVMPIFLGCSPGTWKRQCVSH